MQSCYTGIFPINGHLSWTLRSTCFLRYVPPPAERFANGGFPLAVIWQLTRPSQNLTSHSTQLSNQGRDLRESGCKNIIAWQWFCWRWSATRATMKLTWRWVSATIYIFSNCFIYFEIMSFSDFRWRCSEFIHSWWSYNDTSQQQRTKESMLFGRRTRTFIYFNPVQ